MPRWDIFCAVIDNYGDIAVAWRLARQLVAEHNLHVRLWVDDLRPLAALYAQTDTELSQQTLCGVVVCLWSSDFNAVDVADVVIEAFACDIPECYIAAMASCPVKPHWLNLEYLSAEDWVEGCHRLPSPHPRLPLIKHFFFPGFTHRTGGLLREHDLLRRRREFQANPSLQTEFWRQIDIHPEQATFKISLFGYPNPALPALLEAWVRHPKPICCILPNSLLTPQVSAFFGTGNVWQQGNLYVKSIPFLYQEDYDKLLWSCDMNFVRGEDSMVRAIWAGQPFIWHIYPQTDNTHHIKLNAFLTLYNDRVHNAAATGLSDFWRSWNQANSKTLDWQRWFNIYQQIKQHHAIWLTELLEQTDLATQLVNMTATISGAKSTRGQM